MLAVSLFWRIFGLNAVVLGAATALLLWSPVTVSVPVLFTEAAVLIGGLAIMLVANAALLRIGLAPLGRLTRRMSTVDVLRPGERLPVSGHGGVPDLLRAFNDMLDRLERERATSAARALSAQESERRRIARELHDEVGQTLTAVLMDLKRAADRVPDDGLRNELVQAQETTRASLDEVRRLAHRLRPGVLEDLGLISALTALTTEVSDHTGLVIRRRFDTGLPALDEQTELVLYRVAQESLTNAARHADATHIELSLTVRGENDQPGDIRQSDVGGDHTWSWAQEEHEVRGLPGQYQLSKQTRDTAQHENSEPGRQTLGLTEREHREQYQQPQEPAEREDREQHRQTQEFAGREGSGHDRQTQGLEDREEHKQTPQHAEHNGHGHDERTREQGELAGHQERTALARPGESGAPDERGGPAERGGLGALGASGERGERNRRDEYLGHTDPEGHALHGPQLTTHHHHQRAGQNEHAGQSERARRGEHARHHENAGTGEPEDRVEWVVLRIEDDGRGTGLAHEGAGIRGMRERALLIGATLEIGSGLAGGTQVSLTLPVRERGA